jgi:hypothetical protein
MLAAIATMLVAATATTTPATNVTATSATLNGTDDTNATTHFEYGTTALYGLTTDDVPVVDGKAHADVTGLTANTTYHFKIEGGDDVTFKTAPNPKPPTVGNQRTSAVTGNRAHLSATVNPNGAATTYSFQYGRRTSYGSRTAEVTLPAGSEPVSVAADLTGLRPYTRYHWRLLARNAAGKSTGRDRTFRTVRVATSLSLFASRGRVDWGRGVMLGGRVTGAGANGMPLALEQQRFPFDTGFTLVRTTHAGDDGGYLFSIDHVWALTRYRVVSQTQTPLTSAVTAVRSRPRVRVSVEYPSRKRALVAVRIRPNLSGELSLQRRVRPGRWRQVRHVVLDPAQGNYGIAISRHRKRARAFRVIVLPVKGAYVKARSRVVWVSPRPARAKASRVAAG